MKKNFVGIIMVVSVLFILGGVIVYQSMNHSEVWQFRFANREAYRLIKRGYLTIVPVKIVDESGMGESIGEDYKVSLDRHLYGEDTPLDKDKYGEVARWYFEEGKLKVDYYDEWDTFSSFHKKKNGKMYATYELLGDDGSTAKYTVEVK